MAFHFLKMLISFTSGQGKLFYLSPNYIQYRYDIPRGIFKKWKYGWKLESLSGSGINEPHKHRRLCPLCSLWSLPALKFNGSMYLRIFEIPLYWDTLVKSTLYHMLMIILLFFRDYATVNTPVDSKIKEYMKLKKYIIRKKKKKLFTY